MVLPEFDLNDPITLLSTCFDSDSISPDGDILWAPESFSDRLDANWSYDGLLHTRVDTVFYYETFGVRRAAVVFETLNYKSAGNLDNCQSCGVDLSVALFNSSAKGERWILERFKKHFTLLGSFGQNGEVNLIQFGRDQWVLGLAMEWSGQGVYTEMCSYFDLENVEKVFNLTLHEDNTSELGAESEKSFTYDKSMHFVTTVDTETGWWDFEIVSRGTMPDNDVPRSVPANTVERYAFNWETGTYMKVCY